MSEPSLLQQISDPASRADPYPLYAQLRKTPVHRQDDGIYVVGTHQEVTALLHDPRVSSDPRNRPDDMGDLVPVRPFILEDGLTHDRLRRATMRHFGPPAKPTWSPSRRARFRTWSMGCSPLSTGVPVSMSSRTFRTLCR